MAHELKTFEELLRWRLGTRDFYELCQDYRWEQVHAAKEFAIIKDYLLTGKLPWPSYGE